MLSCVWMLSSVNSYVSTLTLAADNSHRGPAKPLGHSQVFSSGSFMSWTHLPPFWHFGMHTVCDQDNYCINFWTKHRGMSDLPSTARQPYSSNLKQGSTLLLWKRNWMELTLIGLSRILRASVSVGPLNCNFDHVVIIIAQFYGFFANSLWWPCQFSRELAFCDRFQLQLQSWKIVPLESFLLGTTWWRAPREVCEIWSQSKQTFLFSCTTYTPCLSFAQYKNICI